MPADDRRRRLPRGRHGAGARGAGPAGDRRHRGRPPARARHAGPRRLGRRPPNRPGRRALSTSFSHAVGSDLNHLGVDIGLRYPSPSPTTRLDQQLRFAPLKDKNSMRSFPFSFGPDFPAVFIVVDGTPMPLVLELLWSRTYQHPRTKTYIWIPRLVDGSATISLNKLEREWSDWSPKERRDLCLGMDWVTERSDFQEMIRFVMRQSDPGAWVAIAGAVAASLPQDEAFSLLQHSLGIVEPMFSPNIVAALVRTGHPSVRDLLVDHVQRVMKSLDIGPD